MDTYGCREDRAGSVYSKEKYFGLVVSCMVHGNEVGGLDVIIACLEELQSGSIQALFPIVFTLGNIEAGYEGQRFLERDMNRCFGLANPKLPEELRAAELGKIFSQTEHLLASACDEDSFQLWPRRALS